MNQVVLVGRLKENVQIELTDKGNKISFILLEVQRNFKNSDGLYDYDIIPCVLWNGIAQSTKDKCSVGDVLGIKGRIQSHPYEKENEETKYYLEVVAEKVTYLS